LEKRVSAASCPDYSPDHVREAIKKVLEPFGGLSFVKPGMTVAIKVNLIAAREPEKAATTHPALVLEFSKMLREAGACVIIGDSPGGAFSKAHLSNVYRVCGLENAAAYGAELNDDFSDSEVSFPEAVAAKTFRCTTYLQKADCVINFCKLKTHGMMKMTCAVKNMFGAIPGMTKPEYHMRFPDPMVFADMLLDLNEYFRPVLHLVDAVDAMEGNGPTAGTPRHVGLILAGSSSYAVDEVCAHLIGLSGSEIPTIVRARERGLSEGFSNSMVTGENLSAFCMPDFRTDIRQVGIDFGVGGGPLRVISRLAMQAVFGTRPQVHEEECIGCGVCAGVCPAHAITMEQKLPVIDRSACIRCFCCQEFCPKGAMKVHRSQLGRLLTRG
jgi:uncharacterized protein (DUF362 family)/ferredoxin